MDGLEISEIPFSYVKSANDIFRLDSFYFSREFLHEEKTILQKEHKLLVDLASSLRSFGAYSLNNEVEYLTYGIPFIRGVNLKGGSINFSDMVYISPKSHALLWKSAVKPKTILLSMSGTIGDVALAEENLPYPINSNQDIAKIDLNGSINPCYVFAFLRSKFGQNYLRREARGSVQQHVFLSQMEQFKIPTLSNTLQYEIEKVVCTFHACLEDSKNVYKSAETMLLSHLGLDSHILNPNGIAVKTLLQSFGSSGRLDSEYYQPKYEEIEGYIKNYPNGCVRLDNYLKCINTGEYSESYSPRKAGLVFYIRSTNISKGLIENDDDYYVNPKHFKRQVKTGDIITARVGTIGIFGEITEEFNNSIYSDNILCFRLPSECIPSVYTLLFNSSIMYELVDRLARGSVQQRLNQETLKDLFIPILEKDIQLEIAEKVQQSFALRKQSAQLLELAKTAVEIAIEQGEEKALAMLEGVRI